MRRIVIAVLLLSACGDDDVGDPSQYVSANQYNDAAKAAQCAYLTRCGLFADTASCESAYPPSTIVFDSSLIAAINAGRVLYNGNNARTCLDATANATCDKTDEAGRAQPKACRELFRGTLKADAPCYLPAECISGLCDRAVVDETCAPGTCFGDTPPSQELAGNGESCATVACLPGLRCGNALLCEPLQSAGTSCVTTADCAYGTGCAGSPRTCKALPAIGEPCPDGICRDEGAACTANGCVAFALAGASCPSGNECSPYYPCDFSTRKCKQPPRTGEACTSGNTRCADQSYCDSATLKCIPYRGVGEICSSSLQCASSSCDLTTSTCVEPTTCP